jgi:hypothetical protein
MPLYCFQLATEKPFEKLADAVLPGKACYWFINAWAFPAEVGTPPIDFGRIAPDIPYLITGD